MFKFFMLSLLLMIVDEGGPDWHGITSKGQEVEV